MVARIWLARFLCRNKRTLTAGRCYPPHFSPLGCSPPHFSPLGCSPLGPQREEDDQKICLGRSLLHFDCSSLFNLEGVRVVCENYSRSVLSTATEECKERCSRSMLDTAVQELAPSRTLNTRHGSNVCELVRGRTTRPLMRKSLLAFTSTRPFSSDTRTNSKLSDKEDKSSNPFVVVQGDTESLIRKVDKAIEDSKQEFNINALKERFLNKIKPEVGSRGLLLSGHLTHNMTKYVHFRTKDIVGHRPMYMTALDVTLHEKRMKDDEWQRFLNYMVKARIYVIEKWDSSLCHVESLMYDHGIIAPDDGSNIEFYKAECDASYDEKTKEAKLSILIFKGTTIFHCRVYHGLSCESSVLAEIYAAAALFMIAEELGISKLLFWTDCAIIHQVVSGEHNIKLADKYLGHYMMLRDKKKGFERVISMWKPRELNQFVDELATLDKETTLHHSFPLQAMKRWKHQLAGSHVFRFRQKNDVTNVIKEFADVSYIERGPATSTVMLDTEKVSKFDCLLGLEDGFRPDDLYVAVHEFREKPQELQLKIVEFFGDPVEFVCKHGADAVTFFHKSSLKNKKQEERKSMMVLFDATLLGKSFHSCQLTVVLVPPEDVNLIARRKLRKLTALDYVRFSRSI